MTPKPEPKPASEYTPPEPVPEDPPLMDALTFKVCTVCIEVDRIIKGLEHGP